MFVSLSGCLSVNLSVCLSRCLSGCLAVCTWILAVDTIPFERVSGSKQNLVGVFYGMKCGSGIEIHSKIMILILILNRIFIFTITLQSDTKFSEHR